MKQVPYKSIEDLPKGVRNALPASAQRIYMNAYNRAVAKGWPEDRRNMYAWGAVKKRFKKSDGKWVKMSDEEIVSTLDASPEFKQNVLEIINSMPAIKNVKAELAGIVSEEDISDLEPRIFLNGKKTGPSCVCSKCGQTVSAPAGKDCADVTCPKCNVKCEEKTVLANGVGGGTGEGPGGTCVCPKCKYTESHDKADPCNKKKCPKCGATMTRKESDGKSLSQIEIGQVTEEEKQKLLEIEVQLEAIEAEKKRLYNRLYPKSPDKPSSEPPPRPQWKIDIDNKLYALRKRKDAIEEEKGTLASVTRISPTSVDIEGVTEEDKQRLVELNVQLEAIKNAMREFENKLYGQAEEATPESADKKEPQWKQDVNDQIDILDKEQERLEAEKGKLTYVKVNLSEMEDPYKYTLGAILDQILLVENHVQMAMDNKEPELCHSCMKGKHLPTIRALSKEGTSVTKDAERKGRFSKYAQRMTALIEKYEKTKEFMYTLQDSVRDIRKDIEFNMIGIGVLSDKAMSSGWIPEKGTSGLTTGTEETIPEEYRYWLMEEEADRISTRNKLAEAINSGSIALSDYVDPMIPGKIPDLEITPNDEDLIAYPKTKTVWRYHQESNRVDLEGILLSYGAWNGYYYPPEVIDGYNAKQIIGMPIRLEHVERDLGKITDAWNTDDHSIAIRGWIDDPDTVEIVKNKECTGLSPLVYFKADDSRKVVTSITKITEGSVVENPACKVCFIEHAM